MSRVLNFSPGPATLPLSVLEHMQSELCDWQGSGMSVMEISHRSPEFLAVAREAEADLRKLLAVPDNYVVLFMQGGATLQFAATAMNLCEPGTAVDYAITGSWSKKAAAEADALCSVNRVADGKASGYTEIPPFDSWKLNPNAAYLHIAANETIGGVEFHDLPETGKVPVVADFSSTILSRPVDVSRYGVIYAGAQKNIGPAGLTLVIVREDLLGRARKGTPRVLDYALMHEAGSMLNTPPTFAWYAAGLVFKWLLQQGGLESVAARNRRKKDKLYAAIDESDFYQNPVAPADRSWMNIPFTLSDPSLDGTFLEEAKSAGLVNLKGHRSVGGMRASLYNAMAEEGVDALINFMKDFAAKRG